MFSWKLHLHSIASGLAPRHRLANATQKIMSAGLFYQLLVCAAVTAFNLSIFESNPLVSLECLVSAYQMSSVIIPTFIYCYLSNIVSTNLLGVGNIFYGCNWYEWPTAQKQLLILTIRRSQRRFIFNGFELLNCSLEMFLSVNNYCDRRSVPKCMANFNFVWLLFYR